MSLLKRLLLNTLKNLVSSQEFFFFFLPLCTTCKILVLQLEIELGPQPWKWNSLNTGLPGNSSKEYPYTKSYPWVLKRSLVYFSEKAMAPHSSTLAWKIPWTEEPDRLQSMGLQRVGHDWAILLSRIGEGNGNPLQCSCLENPRDGGARWTAVCGVTQSWTQLKWLSSSSSSLLLGI